MSFNFSTLKAKATSQSGTYITQALSYLERRGVKLSKAVSVGNEANINLIDAFEYLGEDEQTKAIALYIEGVKEVIASWRSLEKSRPINPSSRFMWEARNSCTRSGKSHVGAMATLDYLYDGLFKQAGIIRVDSAEELYLFGWMLATQPLPKRRRVGIVTNSGGLGSTIADALEKSGSEVPKFSDALQERIKQLIPPPAQTGNPVDTTFDMDAIKITENIPELLMKSGEVDAVILHGGAKSGIFKIGTKTSKWPRPFAVRIHARSVQERLFKGGIATF